MKPSLVQYWHSPSPPEDVAALLGTFSAHNRDLEHRVFDRAAAEALIAARLSPRELAAFRACAVPAMQADYFRYCAVWALGGVYADADFRCVAPLAPLLDLAVGGGLLFGRAEVPPAWPPDVFGSGPRVGPFRLIANSVFAFPRAGHPLLRLIVELATANIERRVAEDIAVVTGPGILTSLYLVGALGSFDAYRAAVRGSALAPAADLFCEIAGTPARVGEALADVRVAPIAEANRAIVAAGGELAYKSTPAHWVNHRGSVFR